MLCEVFEQKDFEIFLVGQGVPNFKILCNCTHEITNVKCLNLKLLYYQLHFWLGGGGMYKKSTLTLVKMLKIMDDH